MLMTIYFINILKAVLFLLCIFVVIKLAFLYMRRVRRNAQYLYKTSIVLISGAFLLVMCLTIWIYSLITGGFLELLKMFLASLLFFILGLYSFLLGFNWRIDVFEDSFDFRNIFGKKRRFLFSQITKITPISIGGDQISVDGVKISVDPFVNNSHLLYIKLKQFKINFGINSRKKSKKHWRFSMKIHNWVWYYAYCDNTPVMYQYTSKESAINPCECNSFGINTYVQI